MAALVLAAGRRRRVVGPPRLASGGPVDVALSLLVHRSFPLRNRVIRLGLDWLGLGGPAPPTLGVLAARHGVSRQRLQTVLGELRTAASVCPMPPALRAALTCLGDGPAGLSAGEAAALMVGLGVAAGPVHPLTLVRAAGLFGLTPGFALRASDKGTLVVPNRHAAAFDRAVAFATGATRRRGLVPVASVRDRPSNVVADWAVLAVQGIVVQDGWCWRVPDRSPLVRVLARLLTPAGPLPFEEVRAGLTRATRFRPARTAEVPAAVLLAYLVSQPDYDISGDLVALVVPRPGALTNTDRTILDAFSSRRAAELPTGDLVATLVGSGRSRKAAEALIGVSPLLDRTAPGVQRLRGRA